MSLTDEQYLVLSNIAYIDFNINTDRNKTIGQLLSEGKIDVGVEWQDALQSVTDFKLTNFRNNNGWTGSGFAGSAFETPSGETVFAFRGTEPDKADQILHDLAITDGHIALQLRDGLPQQFYDARKFVEDTLSPNGRLDDKALNLAVSEYNVTFTGHSLGGGHAQYMTYLTHDSGTTRAVTFNGVGIGQLLPYEDSYSQYRVRDYCDSADIIGVYGVQLGETVYLKNSAIADSSNKGLKERFSTYFGQVFGIGSHGVENFLDDFDELGRLIPDNVVENNDIGFVSLISDVLHTMKTLPERIAGMWDSEYNVIAELVLSGVLGIVCWPLYIDVFIGALKKNIELFVDKAKEFFGMAVDTLKSIGELIVDGFERMAEGVKNFAQSLGDSIRRFAEGARNVWNGLVDKVRDIADRIVETGKDAWEKVTEFKDTVISEVSDFFRRVADGSRRFITTVKDAVTDSWNTIVDGAKKGVESVANKTREFIGNRIDDFKRGLGFVRDQVSRGINRVSGFNPGKKLVRRVVKGMAAYGSGILSVDLIRLADLQNKLSKLEKVYDDIVRKIISEANKVTADADRRYSEYYVKQQIKAINETIKQIKNSKNRLCDAFEGKAGSLKSALAHYKKIENNLIKVAAD
ncbi:MAG: hypothetical protein GX660_25215 [Clostridiaceae bacterium]|nr:hypothetical protein [Clostridiaceae bacterium]